MTMPRDRSSSYDESYLRRDGSNPKESPSVPVHKSTLPASLSPNSRVQPSSTKRTMATSFPSSPVHVRTNFGKSRGYTPPSPNKNNGQYANPSYYPRHHSDTESETPSDQRSDYKGEDGHNDQFRRRAKTTQQRSITTDAKYSSAPLAASHPPSGAIASVRTQSRPFDESVGEENEPPPLTRCSGSSTTPEDQTHHSPVILNARSSSAPLDRSFNANPEYSNRFSIPPPRLFDPLPYSSVWCNTAPTSDTINVQGSNGLMKQRSLATVDLRYEESNKAKRGNPIRDASKDDEEDDSLFDFEDFEKRRRKPKLKVRDRREKRHPQNESEDETSIEQVPSNNLSERSQAAWKRKQARSVARSVSSSGSQDFPRASSTARLRPTSTIQAASVSSSVDYTGTPAPEKKVVLNSAEYGQSARIKPSTALISPGVSFGKDDTVHHFEPDPHSDEAADEVDDCVDNNTFSGRSLNSEYTKSAESEVEDLIKDIFMIGSSRGKNPGRRKIKYNPHVKEKLKKSNSSNLNDLTFELDDDFSTSKTPSLSAKQPQMNTSSTSCSIDELKDEDPFAHLFTLMEGGLSAMSSALGLEPRTNPSCGGNDAVHRIEPSEPRGVQNFLSYATDLLGSHSSCDNDIAAEKNVVVETSNTTPSLEEDIRLVDLAVQAARSMHKLKGFEFDESCEINIVSDIKFSVVDLSLPFGLIFQENDVGCWITKVLPDGNAAKTGNVYEGDQLAAIDGVSAIHLKVHEMSHIIRGKGTLADSGVELTFLRYIGPLRPVVGSLAEEGYEVDAAEKTMNSLSIRKSISNSKGIPLTPAQSSTALQERHEQPRGKTKKIIQSSSEKNLASQLPASKSLKVMVGSPSSPTKEKRRFRLFGRKK